MKKLTILLLLFIVFAFAEWDVDPDYDNLTVGDLTVSDNAYITDSSDQIDFSTQLLTDPSFEGAIYGTIGPVDDVWVRPDTLITQHGIVGDTAYHGAKSLRFIRDGNSKFLYQTVTGIVDSTYSLHYYYKKTGTSQITITLQALDAGYSVLGGSSNTVYTGSQSEWTLDSCATITAPATTVRIRIHIRQEATAGASVFWIDLMNLNYSSEITDYSFTPRETYTFAWGPHKSSGVFSPEQIDMTSRLSNIPSLIIRCLQSNPSAYKGIFEVQDSFGIWKSRIDQQGNIWVGPDNMFVTANKYGNSALHLGNVGVFPTGYGELNLASVGSFKITHNNAASGGNVVALEVYNTLDTPLVKIYGDLVITRDVKPGCVTWDLLQSNDDAIYGANGTDKHFAGALHGATADSIIIDSLRVIHYTNHNDVYIDSVYMTRRFTRDGQDNTLIWGDGTDMGAGTLAWAGNSFVVDETVSRDWRMQFVFEIETASAGGNGYIGSVKVYGHYK